MRDGGARVRTIKGSLISGVFFDCLRGINYAGSDDHICGLPFSTSVIASLYFCLASPSQCIVHATIISSHRSLTASASHPGSPEYVTLIPTCASVVNRVFAEFLSRQPKGETPSPLECIHPSSRRERIQSALQKLADLIEDPDIASRDPNSSLSFSCVSPEVYQSQKDILDKEVLDERNAFSPLGLDGRPLRRFVIFTRP